MNLIYRLASHVFINHNILRIFKKQKSPDYIFLNSKYLLTLNLKSYIFLFINSQIQKNTFEFNSPDYKYFIKNSNTIFLYA